MNDLPCASKISVCKTVSVIVKRWTKHSVQLLADIRH